MKPRQLFLRCFADVRDGQWQAFCLDLDLAAQGDSFKEVKSKLEGMVSEYVYDALAGEDQTHAQQLLCRRAPAYLWARYYWYKFLIRSLHIRNSMHKIFKERVPLVPAAHHAA
ncbi:MAG: DUF1902 domain-containing protein [Zoogloeaceae bacterium]|nr:DUF1902 domain-containing protein [Zoogloeaceae bacterium]